MREPVRLASGELWVVGDPDQAIYRFGAGPFDPFARFREDFAGFRVVPLSENYRSQASILEAAKQVIRGNEAPFPRDLRARLEKGLPLEISAHGSEREEAGWIARRIEGLLGGASHFALDSRWAQREAESLSYGLGDIAILDRVHAQARRLEEALERAGLPYRTYAKKVREDGREASRQEDLEDFIESPRFREERISLMSLHRAKGLEFAAVFLAGCEEGLLPCRRRGRKAANAEEERRLFYVGMTRAKSRLFLSYSRKRFLFGKSLEAGPSPFLKDIEEELRVLREAGRRKGKKPKDGEDTLGLRSGRSPRRRLPPSRWKRAQPQGSSRSGSKGCCR